VKKVPALLICLLCCCLPPALAGQDIRILMPASAGTGEAVPVAVAALQARHFVFVWQGRTFTVPAAACPEGFCAQALLPVPLDEKAPQLSLRVSVEGTAPVRQDIRIVQKKYPVQELQVDRAYVDPPPEVQARIAEETRRVREALGTFSPQRWWRLPMQRPVPGDFSSVFGERRVFNGQPRGRHRGLDLRGAEGTPVAAMADGKVLLAEELYFSGNAVYLDHGLGVLSAYAHLSAIEVRPGGQVSAGQAIGKVGSTGRVTGPHLHLGCYALGQAVDPASLLEMKAQP
jgi:murein DD-endopeptidase MepM/ murein hydrolase activator NlpD